MLHLLCTAAAALQDQLRAIRDAQPPPHTNANTHTQPHTQTQLTTQQYQPAHARQLQPRLAPYCVTAQLLMAAVQLFRTAAAAGLLAGREEAEGAALPGGVPFE